MSKGKKESDGKLRVDLIPPEVELALAEVLTYGAMKYGDNNWKKGIEYSKIYGALRRHLLAWRQNDIVDNESGLPHLWHAFTELAFLEWYEINGYAEDFDDLLPAEDENE